MSFRRGSQHWGLTGRLRWTATSASAVALVAMGFAPAVAATHQTPSAASGRAPVTLPPGAVSPHPAAGTPELLRHGTVTQTIRQIVQCGGTMYAVGSFTQISQNGTPFTRSNIFSFSASATSNFAVTSWNPNVNGQVNSIALTSDCAHAYIGGSFTKVSGTAVQNIAEIRTDNGTVVASWPHQANGEVDTLLLTPNGHLLAGGKFTSINGSSADKYFASLSPATGTDDGFLRLNISGHYHYCDSTGKCSVTFPTQVYNQQLSNGGTLDLAEGVFTSVGGKPRQQIFMLDLATNPASVTGWTSPEFDGSKGNLPGGYPYQCWFTESFYLRAAAWAPGDSTIYTATTGFHPWNQPTGTAPRTGLCDSTAAWPATHTSVTHTWINYTGCDSLFSAAADNGAVYVAGHPRWANNSDGCNQAGPGAVPDQGLQGISPSSGKVLVNAKGNAIYSMSRANADDMLITGKGLWIASTDRFGASFCGDVGGHAGICFLPY